MKQQKRISGQSDDKSQDSDQELDNSSQSFAFTLTPQEIQDARQKEKERESIKQQITSRQRPSASATASTTTCSTARQSDASIQYQEQVARHWETEFVEDGDEEKEKERSRASASTLTAIPRPKHHSFTLQANGFEANNDSTTDVEEEFVRLNINPEVEDVSSTTNPFAQERAANTSQPGAFAQDGPGVENMERRDNSAVEETLEALESQQTNGEAEKTERQLRNSVVTVESDGLVSAEMVDDAEPIFYAEDVQRDFFKRNRIVIVSVGIIFCAIVVTLSVILAGKNKGEGDPPGDNRCWPSNLNASNATAPLLCFCLNSTKAMYDQFDEVNKAAYARFLGIMQQTGVTDSNATFDFEGCEPENQALLSMSNGRTFPVDKIKETTQGRAIDWYVGLYIYITMNGINWIQQDNWFEDSSDMWDMCRWHGVECLFVGVLAEFDFHKNNLSGTIPTQILNLQNLRTFRFSQNPGITGTIPTEIGGMFSLDSLSLHNCNLTGPIPSELGSLEHLNELELGSNRLSGTIPYEMFQMEKLKILELQENQFSGKLPSECKMPSLELLNIAWNDFSGKIPHVIGRPQRLNLINLMSSGFTGSLPETLCRNTNTTLEQGTGQEQSGPGKLFRRQDTRSILVNCNSTKLCNCCSSNMSDRRSVEVICAEAY
jgi:hypothetical protein